MEGESLQVVVGRLSNFNQRRSEGEKRRQEEVEGLRRDAASKRLAELEMRF
jgi:hypothetical protein